MFNNIIPITYLEIYIIISGLWFFMTISVLKNSLSFSTVIRVMALFWGFLSILNFVIILTFHKLIFSDTLNTISVNLNVFQNLLSTNLLVFTVDNSTFFFLLVVSIISTFANYHTSYYMRFDQKKEKFIFFLNAFAFSMVFLVISRNLFLLFLFWELLGVTSFFLIKHNDTQQDSLKSAMKAFSFNKISDILLVFVLIIYFSLTKNFNINNVDIMSLVGTQFNYFDSVKYVSINIMLLFLFVAACIKSIQIFSYWWLPDSMKAPVPASALIHSATLVTAGFFLINLFKPLFVCFWGSTFFLLIGSCTFILGSSVAAYQDDLKKTLAYSTIANCGMMLCLLFNFNIDLFLIYFLTHGLMKSLSFMICGEIITLQNHSQDSRTYSRTTYSFFISLAGLILSVLVLAGLPITVMYTIKHSFLTPISGLNFWYFFNSLFFVYGFLSILYAINLVIKIFYNAPNQKQNDTIFPTNFLHSGYMNLIYAILALLISASFVHLENTNLHKLNVLNIYTLDTSVSSFLIFVAWGFIINFILMNYNLHDKRTYLKQIMMFVYLLWLVNTLWKYSNYFDIVMYHIIHFSIGFVKFTIHMFVKTVIIFFSVQWEVFTEVIECVKLYHDWNMYQYDKATKYPGRVFYFNACPAPEIIREIYSRFIRPYILWPFVMFTDYLIFEPWYWNTTVYLSDNSERIIRLIITVIEEVVDAVADWIAKGEKKKE